MLTSSIDTQMTDNGGGTYSYSYTVTRPGIITVAILLYTQGGVFNEFFTSPDQSGNSVANGTWPNINLANAANNYFYSGQGTQLFRIFYPSIQHNDIFKKFD